MSRALTTRGRPIEDRPCFDMEGAPDVGQHDPAAGAGQEPNPHLALQGFDLLRQRRLREIEARSRTMDVPLLGNGHEIAKVSQLHPINKMYRSALVNILDADMWVS